LIESVFGLDQVLVAAFTMFAGATIFCTVGFGIGVTTIPVLLLFFDPQTVVVVINTVSLPMFSLVVYQTRKDISMKEVIPLAISALVGIPIGLFVLASVEGGILRVSIAILVILLVPMAAVNSRFRIPSSRGVVIAAGIVTSTILTAFGVGGALLVLAFLTRNMARHTLRGSLSLFFLIVESASVIGYVITGMFTPDRIFLTTTGILPVILGFFLSVFIARRMNELVFKKALIGTVIMTSLVVLVREIIL